MDRYRVVYITIPASGDQHEAGRAMEDECNRQAADDFRLVAVLPDTSNGTARGCWLYFERDDALYGEEAIGVAEEIIRSASGNGSHLGGRNRLRQY